jgi:uncharacterized protein (TIGR02118 family)
MSLSIQVLYPFSDNTNFDFEYYVDKHLAIVKESIGFHIENVLVTKGIAGGQDAPPAFHAIATITFRGQSERDAAMANIDAAVKDIPNFTNSKPIMLIGEVVS